MPVPMAVVTSNLWPALVVAIPISPGDAALRILAKLSAPKTTKATLDTLSAGGVPGRHLAGGESPRDHRSHRSRYGEGTSIRARSCRAGRAQNESRYIRPVPL